MLAALGAPPLPSTRETVFGSAGIGCYRYRRLDDDFTVRVRNTDAVLLEGIPEAKHYLAADVCQALLRIVYPET